MYIYTFVCRYFLWITVATNNTANETFSHKSGAVLSVDWIITIGAPVCLWLGQWVTLDKMFYSPVFKQEVGAAPSYFDIFILVAFLEETFVRNTITILWTYYTNVIIISINNNNNNAIISNNCGRLPDTLFCSLTLSWTRERISSKPTVNLGMRSQKGSPALV